MSLIDRILRMAVILFFLCPTISQALTVDKAEMGGSEIRVEGSNAAPNTTVNISSLEDLVSTTSDGGGDYRAEQAGFSSSDCQITVSDGVDSVATSLSGCTPTAPPPPPVNQSPLANAGPDLTLFDNNSDGLESALLDGSQSSDPDGNIVSWVWSEEGVTLASGQNPTVILALGIHTVDLTVTDNAGATASDTLIIAIETAQPPALPARGPDTILESNQVHEGSFDPPLMGASVASAGDVNGDGFEDVVVGALGWETPGGLFDEGAVFVFLGSANGIVGTDPTNAHAVIQATQPGSEFGTSVSGAGDVNGDGFDDIIVGAPLTNASDFVVSGAAYVFLGSPAGISATSPADAHAVLESKQIEGHMGRSVSGAGDVNGDGFDDVIVGAGLFGEPFNPPIPNQGSGRQGAAFVFLGSPTGIVGNEPANAHAQLVPWADGTPSQPGAGFGMSVSGAGDVNGDGFDDVMVGAPFWNRARIWPGLDTGDPPEEGAVFIYHGGPAGITGTNAANADTRIESNQLEAFLGNSVSDAGDVNNDGFGDIIVGAFGFPAGDPLLVAEEGAALVFLGGPGGITASDPSGAQTIFQGTELAEWVGRSVSSAGDFDGDGFDDVIVGARVFPGSLNSEGAAYVFRGGLSGILGSSLADAYFKITSNRAGGNLGGSVHGAGNIDGDARSDLILGVPGYSGGEHLEGAAFIYQGTPSTNPPNQVPVANAGADATLVDSNNDGSETTIVDGSASFDADGAVTVYEWREGVNLLGSTASITTPPLAIGDHTLTLTVTDNSGASSSDSMQIRVITGVPNQDPVANAGQDQTVADDDGDGFATVTLDGSASTDPDGSIVDYIWREGTTILGTGVTLTLPLAVGIHTIFLQVNDNTGAGSQDSVVVTVTEGGAPPPAQGNVTISGPSTANRGETVSFTVTLNNTGSVSITNAELYLRFSPVNLVKNLNPAGAVPVTDVPAGGSVSVTWNGRADRNLTGAVTGEAFSGGISLGTANMSLTVVK